MAPSIVSSTETAPRPVCDRRGIISQNSSSKHSIPSPARRLLSHTKLSAFVTSTHSLASVSPYKSTPITEPPKPPSKLVQPGQKHTPIVIPHYAYSDSQDYSLNVRSDHTITIPEFPPTPTSLTHSIPSTKLRYVEIKIPDSIASKYLPQTPGSLQFSSSGEDSDSIFSGRDPNSDSDSASSRSDIVSLGGFPRSDKEHKDSVISIEKEYHFPPESPTQGQINTKLLKPVVQFQYDEMNSVAPAGKVTAPPQLFRLNTQDMTPDTNPQIRTPASSFQPTSAGLSPAPQVPSQTSSSNIGLSGFVCNVHRTTGREPRPLVGATTTIVGDKLYVFGGRRISRAKTQLTSDLYELDLIRRHWTKLECKGDVPPPRYFHSVCALGDTKLVCYGGMSQSNLANGSSQGQDAQSSQNAMDVMSDIHIFDISTRKWMKINSSNAPQGRYAHCATILPSSAVFASQKATYSAIQHNVSSADTPNQGKLGVSLDGSGGAEMVIVGGQDSTNHYIEQISVFNLRSLTWTSTSPLGRQCGAYRSVTAPLNASVATAIGMGVTQNPNDAERAPQDGGSAMLIYSNYNFLDVKLELQIHLPDGTLVEKPMQGGQTPPGLRFPNGGVIDNHFVVSGTFLTSYKQEYALWALDLRSLLWTRIDIGSSTFSQGSWNRGILWQRRNAFVILGNRKRSLVEDYNHRRVNFSNMCVVELEAFGLYDNPRRLSPMSGYISASSPIPNPLASREVVNPYNIPKRESSDRFGAGRELSRAAQELGRIALGSPELADMDILAINGERIPINSSIVSRRWGPFFTTVLREAVVGVEGNDTATLRPSFPNTAQSSRNSSITITPSMKSAGNESLATTQTNKSDTPENTINPATRPRTLYLPHTPLTIHALLHFLYTSSLPPTSSPLCTPQILCSLLQIARPYKVDGLLEAVVERLHAVLDNRNTAAIFNAAAMAAGGGEGIEFVEDAEKAALQTARKRAAQSARPESPLLGEDGPSKSETVADARKRSDPKPNVSIPNDDDSENTSPSNSGAEASEDDGERQQEGDHQNEEVWSGSLSAVVGLQKRGLRGLMEGRRIREGSRDATTPGNSVDRVGLGIEKG